MVLQRGEQAVAGFAEELVRCGIKVCPGEDIRIELAEAQGVRNAEAVGGFRHGERGNIRFGRHCGGDVVINLFAFLRIDGLHGDEVPCGLFIGLLRDPNGLAIRGGSLGKGVEKDETEAVNWFRKAADQGYAGAQLNLGLSYENGSGVKQDKVEAAKWYHKAAEQGFEPAKEALKYLNN